MPEFRKKAVRGGEYKAGCAGCKSKSGRFSMPGCLLLISAMIIIWKNGEPDKHKYGRYENDI